MVAVLTLILAPPVKSEQPTAASGDPVAGDQLSPCATLLRAEQYQEARRCLEPIVSTLEQQTSFQDQAMLESLCLGLALAYLETNAAGQAEDLLQRLLERFPGSTHRSLALVLLVESWISQQKWQQVDSHVPGFVSQPGLRAADQLTLQQFLGEARYMLGQYQQAIEVLQGVYDESTDDLTRSEVIALIAICLLREQRVPDFVEWWSGTTDESVRYDLRVVLSLLEAADRCHAEGREAEAWQLYRMVPAKAEIQAQMTRQLTALQRSRQSIDQRGDEKSEQALAQRRQLDRRIHNLLRNQSDLASIDEYLPAVNLRLGQIALQEHSYEEACRLFEKTYTEHPSHEVAEQALYSAFGAAQRAEDAAHAIVLGDQYLHAFPNGLFQDTVGFTLVTLHLGRQQWDEGIAVAEQAINNNPNHPKSDQLLYMLGYALYQRGQFLPAQQQFAALERKFPQSSYRDRARYWYASSYLALANYPAAAEAYMRFLAEFKESQLLEDARYRLALAQYGSHNVDAALQTLRECVADDRSTTLAMDARSMLGDVYASRDQLDEAVSVFRQIVDGAESASQVNYATFQLIKLYKKRHQYQRIVALCREYLARYPTSDKVTEVMFWMVKAEIALGHYQAARDVFSEALVRYGNLPEHLGIDLMLQAVAGAGVDESLFGEQSSEVLLQLEHHLDHSRQHNQRTFELRMVAFFVDSDADPVRRQVWVAQLLNQQDLAVASALTLHVMGREYLSQDQTGRAQEVYEYLLAHYGSSEWGTLAVVALAEMHTASGDYDAALALLEDGRSQLVQKSVPGRVAKIRADVLRLQGSHDEAVEAYMSILGNHEWRGELWPASLFGIGESFRERGELENAFAYYQRVYVLYEGYPRWVARAYLQSAVCLEKLLRHDEAIATYREMLSKGFLTEFKESKQARDALNRLGGKT